MRARLGTAAHFCEVVVLELRTGRGLNLMTSQDCDFISRSDNPAAGFSEALSAQDVAIYGGLCALATFDRTELAAKVPPLQGYLAHKKQHPPRTLQ